MSLRGRVGRAMDIIDLGGRGPQANRRAPRANIVDLSGRAPQANRRAPRANIVDLSGRDPHASIVQLRGRARWSGEWVLHRFGADHAAGSVIIRLAHGRRLLELLLITAPSDAAAANEPARKDDEAE
jgi:hypothetical protein